MSYGQTQVLIHEFFTKNIENWRSWKMAFFQAAILDFFFKFFLHHLNENKQPIHMRYHLFLHYGWFLQNLGKYFVQTNMHMTVAVKTTCFTRFLLSYLNPKVKDSSCKIDRFIATYTSKLKRAWQEFIQLLKMFK